MIFTLVSDADGLAALAGAVEKATLIGLDTETTGLDPRRDRIRILAINLDTNNDDRTTYLIDVFRVDPTPLWQALASKPIILHNAIFDLAFLHQLGFTPGDVVHDTMLLAQLLAAGTFDKVGLAAVVERELGRTLDKKLQKADWTGTLSPVHLEYAAQDAAILVPLYQALSAKITEAGLDGVAEIERRCLPAIIWTATSGATFDQERWNALAIAAQAEADRLSTELDAIAPRRPNSLTLDLWNWDSPIQVVEAFAAAGITVEDTADETLATLDHPLAPLLRDYREVTKKVGTYGKDWSKFVSPDGRIHASWRQIGAASGRMACREPNLQNLPRDPAYRQCLRAPPGRVLIKADYSQIELRIAVKLSRDTALLAAYHRGEDLHTLTARQVLGKTEVSKQDRQLAKALNFGLLYGMGAARFREYAKTQYGMLLTEEQARSYRNAFFRTYPGLARWHQQAGRSGNNAQHIHACRPAPAQCPAIYRETEHPRPGNRCGRPQSRARLTVGTPRRLPQCIPCADRP
jgi:DNA polymerase-1